MVAAIFPLGRACQGRQEPSFVASAALIYLEAFALTCCNRPFKVRAEMHKVDEAWFSAAESIAEHIERSRLSGRCQLKALLARSVP